MDFDPIEVQKHLKGADYATSKEDLASTADGNGVPNDTWFSDCAACRKRSTPAPTTYRRR